ncbi:MAG: S9 family peptidase [Chlamydiia bacterium]|nr:S9 family peptidase [Chlamydiia bacterium]
MAMAQAAPYGSWNSPITSSLIVEKTVSIGSVAIDGEDLYWIESRPEEKGRSALVQFKGGEEKTMTPDPYNVRSRVHEYGGGAFTVLGGEVIFANFKDCGLYRVGKGEKIEPLFAHEKKRYANPVIDHKRGKIYAVEEEHRSDKQVINRLVEVGGKVLHEGHDFYSMPALHPEGTHLAFITWDQPNMPWDGSTLWVGRLDETGSLVDAAAIAGGEKESIFQPMWSPEGVLHYVSDRSGWWNIYDASGTCLCPMEAEFGQPLWVFGMENYTFLGDGRIASVYTVKGVDSIGIIDPKTKKVERIDLPFTSYGSFKASGKMLYFTASSPKMMNALYSYDVTTGKLTTIKESKKLTIDEGYLSEPEAIEFPTEGGRTAFGFYYPPKNKDYEGTELPPLIVRSHGGPTARFSPVLSLGVQYWTSRGFGCLDVNYGGSTGYGRAYRERLNDNWGIVDVDDCVHGALYLVEKGKVDRERLIIKGGSAGGYTTLAALAFKDVFKAGASYYGVSDLEALANDDHKFEARYMDFLVGPYPQEKKRYEALSPIRHVDRLSCPIILFQGGEDRVVPPEQSEKMYDALKKKGIPTAYILFEEEGHGFRSGDNIKKALESELYFYGKVFGFQPSDHLEPLKIENLK